MISIFHPNYGAPLNAQTSAIVKATADSRIALDIYLDGQATTTGLGETVRSIISQSLPAWRLWVRLSEDRTDLPRDSRIKYLHKDQTLQLSAPYVMSVSSGTFLEPTYLEKCVWFLESHPETEAVRGRFVCLGGGGALERYCTTPAEQDAEALMIRSSILENGQDNLSLSHLGVIEEHLVWVRREVSGEFVSQLSKADLPRLEAATALDYQLNEGIFPWTGEAVGFRPRVLMILPWVTMGGSDKFNLDLLEQLRVQGWDVSIATTLPDPHNWLSEFSRYTDDIFAMSYFLKPGDYPRFLSHLMSSRSPDVVLTSHSEFGYLILPYLKAHHPDSVFVDYCHIETFDWMNGGYPNYAVRRQNVLDLNVVSSEHLKRWMIARGAAAAKVEVAQTNIDTVRWKPDPLVRARIREAFVVAENTPVLLYACRVVAQKQPRVFAGVVHELSRRGHEFLSVVAGDGDLRPWLEAYVREHNLQKTVRFLDQMTNEQIQTLMAGSDIFFLPSEWEGISLAIFEAMAMELAIVGADVGGQKELVTPECGVLVFRGAEEEEIAAYVSALEPLLLNPAKCRELGAAARKRVQSSFELEQMGRRMVDLFKQAREIQSVAPGRPVDFGKAREAADLTLRYTQVTEEINLELAALHAEQTAEIQQAAISRIQQLIAEKDELWERIISIP